MTRLTYDQAGAQAERNNGSEARPLEHTRSPAASFDSSSTRPAQPSIELRPAQPSIELNIDELVLHGFEPSQRYAIGEAVQHELTRLLIERGAPVTMTEAIEIEHLNAGSINVDGSNPRNTGREIARAVYRQLNV